MMISDVMATPPLMGWNHAHNILLSKHYWMHILFNMHKKISLLFAVVAFLLIGTPVQAVGLPPVINEFYVAGDTEWVELFNPTDEAIDLTGYTLVPTAGSPDEVALSGTLPRYGFLTFHMAPNTFADDGGAIILKNPESNPVFSVYYGTISGTPHVAAPEANQSANAHETGGMQDSDWSVGNPSLGWCSDQNSNCPSLLDIHSQLFAAGIRTNLIDVDDPSRMYLLLEDPQLGVIHFGVQQNFSDQDAMLWLQSLLSNVQFNQGEIALDTALISQLMSTEATLTMYNISFNNPTILVNNSADSEGVVSELVFYPGTGNLVFRVSHFTTFTAVEGSGQNQQQQASSSTASPTATAPGCDLVAPLTAPDLFQIERSGTTAKLYFAPVLENSSEYVISYGLTGNDWRIGTSLPKLQTSGVEQVEINHLDPKATYWFTVRTGNGCATGPWSSWLEAKPSKTTHKY